ncbi:hypothetical protein G6F37_002529 [Rhizopus arrhizus]|nr:hypothetical protein G6F38_002835 [Rhizopus arrhizus]KAG1162028.1 hypothetical protein G6F37_002529 [Rhizopus arrhizus]
MDKENNSNSLTSFNFETQDDRINDEGVLSKILDKVKSAVSGQSTARDHDNVSVHSTCSETRISNSHEPSVISIPHTVSNLTPVTEHSTASTTISATSQLLGAKDSVMVNFPVSSDSVSRSSTIATTNATVIVGKHNKEEPVNEPSHNNSTVQFVVPSTSSNSLNRKSLEESSVDLLPLYTRKSIDSDTQSVITNFSISNSNSLGRILARLRGQKNDKEFWMPDEQCKECYKCRKPFTLLRRKHHCRTCGQIFCSKCASHIISGKLFKQKGQVRVCNFCYAEQQLQRHDDRNSVAEPIIHFKSTHSPLSKQVTDETSSENTEKTSSLEKAEDYSSQIIPSQKPPLAVPNMQIPTTAFKQPKSTYGNENATTFAVEIPMYGSDSYNSPQAESPHSPFHSEQPTSPILYHSSISANTVNTPNMPDNHVYTGVKRLLDAGSSLIKPRPRSNTSSSAPLLEDARPLQHGSQLPFRTASYLDRGGGTVLAERELSIFPGSSVEPEDAQHEEELSTLYDRPPTPIKTHAYNDKSNGNGGEDSISLTTNGGISDDESYDYRLRAKRTEELRGKNVPIVSSKSSYRTYRRLSLTGANTPKLRGGGLHRLNTSGLAKYDHAPSSAGGSNMTMEQMWSPNPILSPYEDTNKFFSQSDNNNRLRLTPRQRRTSGPPPTVELSLSARQHARRLLRQLMQDIQFTESCKEEWEEVIMNILMKVTNNVQPDTRAGDDMDVRHYVKIKKIPGGLPSDSFYAKGVVCTKNVAHKRMARNMTNPRILILLFSLDYSRVEMENQLLSITPVISQEREHISKLVGRIVALKPSLLLVKSTVSRFALEFLLEANIPVIHNVKHSVIEAVARCTQASIITSVDKLQHGLSFGRCGSFEIRTFMHEWIPNRRKTYLMFDDCSPELGGTIVLRGEKVETLKIIKRLMDFMVFVVNNLKYETSLLRDSFAKNRGSLDYDERDRSPLVQSDTLSVEKPVDLEDEGHNYITRSIGLYQNTILSVSQFVNFAPPYLLLKLKEMDEKLAMIYQQKRRKSTSCFSILKDSSSSASTPAALMLSASPTRSTFDKQPASQVRSSVDKHSMSYPTSTSSYDAQDGGDIALEAEHELIAKSHQVTRAWETYNGETPESISPFYHQNLVVLYSSVCTVTTVPCQGPEIRIFGYYRLPSDKTLGQYIMDLCVDAHQPCTSFMCNHPVLQHYRSYAHGNARINVMIEPFACPLPGMSDKLLMWSYCRKCNKPTPVLPMSENTWNYSFGKFLEIFLYQEGVHCRADICPHDMSKNHVRYFGYMDMTVRFQYDSIDLLEVAVPPMKLYIKSKVQRDLKEAELKSLRLKINRFYQSIIDRNKSFPFDLVDPRKLESCKNELQELSLEAQGEKKDVLQLLQNIYATSDPNDTLTINSVRRNLFQIVAHWEAVYTDLVRFYLEPERELKKITTIHLRKMFPTDLSNMDTDERTKRATEVTDLPLLGIGLDDDEDGLIDYTLKKKSMTSIKTNETVVKSNKPMIMPNLLSSPSFTASTGSSDEDDSMSTVDIPSDSKISFLRPELRRRLSLELMRELNEKFRFEEGTGGGNNMNTSEFDPLNQADSNKYMRLRTTGSLSAAFTPSRIPLYSGKNSSLLYPSYKKDTASVHDSMSGRKQSPPMVVQGDHLSIDFPVLCRLPPLHQRHHSVDHSQRIHQRYGKSKVLLQSDNKDDLEFHPSYLRRSVTSRDKRFRSRLPRKKTYIQVYTQANDLVKEDIDDEFYPGDQMEDAFSVNSRHIKRSMTTPRHKHLLDSHRTAQHMKFSEQRLDSGTDADNDDDSDDELDETSDIEDGNLDYFSSAAPFTYEVLNESSESSDKAKDTSKESMMIKSSLPSSNYSVLKPYITFSDGQIDMSSGASGDDDTDRDLPCASDLLMAQQQQPSANDNLTINDLHNIHPDLANNSASTSLRYITTTTTAVDENRHSPEKMSFMKTLTNFLTDSGIGNLLPLEFPLQPTEHLFPDSFVAVKEDEPSTIIAYTLSSEDYLDKMHDIQNERHNAGIATNESVMNEKKVPLENATSENGVHHQTTDDIQGTLLHFSTGSTKFFCKIFFSEQFDALRRNCGCDESYIMSLANCIKWDSSGGKSGSAFLKTKDDRLLMKQMSKYELDAFLGFAPAYFQYMSEAFFSELPTALAKIFGFYSIGYKNSSTGKSMRMDVLVMENLFYQRNVKKIFDLKGSMRNRHVQSTGKQDEVLLDENLVELIYQSPLFIRAHSKEILRSSLHNDTLFLSNRNVMDYSLLVGIDTERQELVVGIVDFIRTFTWDKKLESWVKESGILGGGGKEPTIVSPRQYRIRFREAMERYFLMVPDFWALTRQNRSYTILHHHTTLPSIEGKN